jgi:hypothetical protein
MQLRGVDLSRGAPWSFSTCSSKPKPNAIISHAAGAIGPALPFFSKQSIVNAARVLKDMGYTVGLAKIAYEH